MSNIILILILVIIFSLAIYKIYYNKKNNIKCSGCPSCKMNDTCQSKKQ